MPTNNAVFVDTSGWIAVLNEDDRCHSQARQLFSGFGSEHRPLVTTDWVFAETGNGLARVNVRKQFAATVREFLLSANCRLLRIDDSVFQRALQVYVSARDKMWGLVDCASFVIMRDIGILDAMTADRHFEQAGFRCLLPAKGR